MNHIISFLRSVMGDAIRMADSLLSVPKNRPSDGAFSRSRLKFRGHNTCYAARKRGDTRTLASGAVYSATERGWVRGT